MTTPGLTRNELLAALDASFSWPSGGLSNQLIADVLLEELEETLDAGALELLTRLPAVPVGQTGQDEYHRLVSAGLSAIFSEQLVDPVINQQESGGRKLIDIVFTNAATEGFFADLKKQPGIQADYVIVECKNYAADIENPELDQLRGRLNRDVGNFGILACRKINDRNMLLKRLADAKRDDKYLICLTDRDIEQLARFARDLDSDAIDRHLCGLWRDVIFS